MLTCKHGSRLMMESGDGGSIITTGSPTGLTMGGAMYTAYSSSKGGISALTLATLDRVASDPGTAELSRRMMTETMAVGEALGVRFSIGIEQRIEGAAEVGPHRTSMLQDLEAGRPMEIDALVTVVAEMAELVGVEVPTIRSVLALLQQRAQTTGP